MNPNRWMAGVIAMGILSAGVALAQAPGEVRPLAPGDPAPLSDVKMKNVDGRELSIADVKGAKGTLVIFTCNACPWARAWHSRIVSIGNRCARQGVGAIAINSNDPGMVAADGYPEMREYAKRSKMAFPYVVDATSDVARAFGASHTPEAYLFDGGGHLVYHGAIDDNAKQPNRVKERYLESAVRAVSSGREIALGETRAMGCSIKFRAKS